MKASALPVPLEHVEQCAVIQWTKLQLGKWPELALIYAVANGQLRDRRVAAKLKAEGVSPGVPDLVLPVARGGYFGMYAEMKRVRGGSLSAEQKWWRDQLIEWGYHWCMFRGAQAAYDGFTQYLQWAPTQIVGDPV